MSQLSDHTPIVGHTLQLKQLSQLVRASKVPPALIFNGRAGIGKRKIAEALARQLLCRQLPHAGEIDLSAPVLATDHHSESCVLPTQGEHPDLYQIDASSDSVNLATIRDLVSKLKLVPFLGGARVVLIDNGEQLSNLSYQLLLKPIEECTPRTHFVILTSALLRIPVTIRSRSTLMNFGELSSIELVQIIKGQSAHLKDSQLLKDDLQLKELLALGDGTVGTALSMIEGQGEWEQLKQLFRALRQSGFKAVLDLVDFFTKHTKELDSRLALLRVFVRAAVKRSRSVEAKRHWALLLTNVLEAERLLWDRKLPAEQLLLPLFNDFQSSLRDRTDPELISSYDVYSS